MPPLYFTDAKRHCFAFISSRSGSLWRFSIVYFSPWSPALGLWVLTILIPAEATNRNLLQVMGFNNWEWKYTKVITIFSSLCSFISTELWDKRVLKTFWLAGCVPARIPGQLPIHRATPPSIYHGKVPTATRNSLYVQFPSPGKILTSCFNVKSSWAASQAGFLDPQRGERPGSNTQFLLWWTERQNPQF